MRVSVIIPIYNVAQFLDRCIDSVLKQTFNNLEIILVDDGSTDTSGEICDRWERKDTRIRVIHKANGGLSSARNSGIEAATGDAIFLLDSDDYISSHCIETCVRLMTDYEADISIIQMLNVSERTNEEIIIDQEEVIKVLSSQDAIKESLYQKKFSCSAPGKLYKKDIFADIRFPEGRVAEDLATCHFFFNAAHIIVYSNRYLYYYRQREHSIMHTFNPKRMDALEWAQKIEEFCKHNYPGIHKASICRSFNVAIHLLLDLPDSGEVHEKYIGIIWKTIRRTRGTVIVNQDVRQRERVAAILSIFGERALKRIWRSRFSVKRKSL